MHIISVWVPENILEYIELLVQSSHYPNRSEIIRDALRNWVKEELKTVRLIEKRTGIIREKVKHPIHQKYMNEE